MGGSHGIMNLAAAMSQCSAARLLLIRGIHLKQLSNIAEDSADGLSKLYVFADYSSRWGELGGCGREGRVSCPQTKEGQEADDCQGAQVVRQVGGQHG